MGTGADLRAVQTFAAAAQRAGLSGLVVTEGSRTAYLTVAAAALAADQLHLSTGVAVAFPRSPMVTAQSAWELAEATGGRFRLGLGTQVRIHAERRYGVPFDPPGPRLREYVQAVKAIFRAFRGDGEARLLGDLLVVQLHARGLVAGTDLRARPTGRRGGREPVDVADGRPGRRRCPRAPAALHLLPRRGGPARRCGRGPSRPVAPTTPSC